MTEATDRPALTRRAVDAVRFPPPTEEPIFTDRGTSILYLLAWVLTVTHLTLWVLTFVGLVTGNLWLALTSVLSFVATGLLIGLVLVIRRRVGGPRGKRLVGELWSAWWRGPWDPVGRLVWLPARLPHAWRAARGQADTA